jgi:hypothetical protein
MISFLANKSNKNKLLFYSVCRVYHLIHKKSTASITDVLGSIVVSKKEKGGFSVSKRRVRIGLDGCEGQKLCA